MPITIEEFVAANDLGEYRYELGGDDPDWPVHTFHVPRDRVDAVRRLLLSADAPAGSVRVEQVAPALVPARPGQLVLIYSEYHTSDELSPVGVVTSVQEIDGRTAYGCSYIQLALGDRLASDLFPIHMTGEDYGGYHAGFLRTIEPNELETLLYARVEQGYRAAVERAAAMRAQAERAVPELLAMLGKGTVEQVTRWGVSGDDRHHDVNIQLPVRHARRT